MFVSASNYKPTIVSIGNTLFRHSVWAQHAHDAAARIHCSTRNPKSPVKSVVVKANMAVPIYTTEQLRTISEMITWCLNEGQYMWLHPQHGYLDNKFMCLILTSVNNRHDFSDTNVDMCVEYIMAHVDSSSDGIYTAVSSIVKHFFECECNKVIRTKALEWYQLLLNDIESKINELEKEAA